MMKKSLKYLFKIILADISILYKNNLLYVKQNLNHA